MAIICYNNSKNIGEFSNNFVGNCRINALNQIRLFLRYNEVKQLSMNKFVNEN